MMAYSEYTFESLENKSKAQLEEAKKDLLDELHRRQKERYALIGQVLFYQEMIDKDDRINEPM